jgi:NurA-like 5'-3' nuclease
MTAVKIERIVAVMMFQFVIIYNSFFVRFTDSGGVMAIILKSLLLI